MSSRPRSRFPETPFAAHFVATPLPLASTRGLVVERLGYLFIAFEGTDPFIAANWVTNFDFVPDQDGIHQGFATALEACWPI